jgi:pentalenene oxygenase
VRLRAAVRRLDALVFRIISERRADGADRGDLLSALLCAHDEDGPRMTDRQLRDVARLPYAEAVLMETMRL